jgi:hypothetical protein
VTCIDHRQVETEILLVLHLFVSFYLEELKIDGIIILIEILKKWSRRVWINLIFLRIRTHGRLLFAWLVIDWYADSEPYSPDAPFSFPCQSPEALHIKRHERWNYGRKMADQI